ncbi:MAG: 4a-hydroxytetrahydrobiopterin dehydratase [Cyanobacteria bacterium HKST-UBA02]|nr:4a-hydroxytetrahydrobiopterin dehydratase [Cyanobacteria bacterium HKST-UBA02]
MSLADRACVPCRGGTPVLSPAEIEPLLAELSGWTVENDRKLVKSYQFKNFKEPMDLAVRIGELAEEQGHHPDLTIAWGKLQVELWTHKIGGLSESDFVLAAKIDRIST